MLSFINKILTRPLLFPEFDEPILRLGTKDCFLSPPKETHFARMKRVMRQQQSPALLRRQAVLDQRQIQVFVAAVKFIADDGVPDVREMNADLMFAASQRPDAEVGSPGTELEFAL